VTVNRSKRKTVCQAPVPGAPGLDADGGWLRGARRVVSPNQDARPAGCEVELLVIHAISLPPGEFGGGHIDRLFTNTLDFRAHPGLSWLQGLRVSAHLLIDRSGAVTQYVPFPRRAWHAGRSAFCGRADCNDYSIGIELEGCDRNPFEPCQYRVLAGITALLQRRWRGLSRDRIVGHCDIAPGRKTDPGPHFEWDRYYRLLDRA